MLFERESGVLLHPSSLPGPFGTGEIGAEAIRWLDLLEQMGQSLWQVLPLTPPGMAASPYQARSSFAGNPLLISLQSLAETGLLTQDDLAAARGAVGASTERVNFAQMEASRAPLLRRAAVRFLSKLSGVDRDEFDAFCKQQDYWLHDYARFQAIKNARAGDDWLSWPEDIKRRQPQALENVDFELSNALRVEKALQFLFERQWQHLRIEARRRNIRIIGDLPIFVALDSADVWASQHLFQLGADGQPRAVAGVPPDYFSKTGQRWGNPLFDWEANQLEGFQWWTRRMRRTLEMADVTRVDHFRGFAACWEIPADEPTAEQGRWAPTPGAELFAALQQRLGSELSIIAEDLGIVTEDVDQLRDSLGLPTMRILQFSFTGDPELLPHRYPENSVCYTGTHDNDTSSGWYHARAGDGQILSDAELEVQRDRVRRYYGTDGTDIHFTAIRGVLQTQACAALFPLQDVLGLGSEARMNTPGTMGSHNWSWRFDWSQLTSKAVETVAAITRETERNQHLL